MSVLGSTAVKVSVIGNLLSALGLVTGQAPIDYEKEFDFVNGTGANQADDIFSDHRSLAASASESLDLNTGTLKDAFGNSVDLTKIKALIIKADPNNVNDVVVGAAGSNPIISILGSTGTVLVKPGGIFVVVAPDVNGYAITPSTAMVLKVANSGAGTGIVYDIIVIGV